jgi:hypothetical protein
MAETSKLIPVNDWPQNHAWPPIGGLRHLIFYAETNGFKSAFKRVGRRVLIDEAEFFRCVEKVNSTAGKVCTGFGNVVSNKAHLGGAGNTT